MQGKEETRTEKLNRWVSIIVFVLLVGSAIFVGIRLFMAPSDAQWERPKGDYVLMLVQCTMGAFIMLLPGILAHRFRLEIPSAMYLIFALFLFCAIYLGEVRSFYYRIPYWDSVLHCFSGAMLGALSFSALALLNKTDRIPLSMSPLFVVVFAFCFSMTLGALWEVYEYTFDGLLSMNMQKFALEDGTLLEGRAALADTMKDIMINAVGALVTSLIGYSSMKLGGGRLNHLLIRFKRDPNKKRRSHAKTKTRTGGQ
jgi:hypothetical protein